MRGLQSCTTMKSTALLLCAALFAGAAQTKPLVPKDDAQIVQTLDRDPARRAADRELRERLSRSPRDVGAALALAESLLGRARGEGDARWAGQALAALSGFSESHPPPEVALLRATLQQHLHDFETSARGLQRLVERPQVDSRTRAQALLLLAGVRRTQGRLDASDAACKALELPVQAAACALENAALRDPLLPLAQWDALLRASSRQPATQAWLLLSKAEHAQRAGQNEEAEAAFRAALAGHDDAYTRCALADLLQAQGRSREALDLLEGLPSSDAVAVRRAALARELNDARAREWASALRQRFTQSRERQSADPREPAPHLREQAQFALQVDQRPEQALRLALRNVRQQREAIDLLLLAQAAEAAHKPQALQQALQLAQQIGLRDARLPTPPSR